MLSLSRSFKVKTFTKKQLLNNNGNEFKECETLLVIAEKLLVCHIRFNDSYTCLGYLLYLASQLHNAIRLLRRLTKQVTNDALAKATTFFADITILQ